MQLEIHLYIFTLDIKLGLLDAFIFEEGVFLLHDGGTFLPISAIRLLVRRKCRSRWKSSIHFF